MKTSDAVLETAVDSAPVEKYQPAIAYLRGFIVALVVAHHAVLAYYPYGPPIPQSLVALPHWWEAFPVLDSHRSTGFATLVGFNDIFFMSLLFLLSGLFVAQSWAAKGTVAFLRGRLIRLGVPFLVAAGVVSPLAYYPAYLQTATHTGFSGFVHQWLSLGEWPAGPAWFMWVLLVFDCLAALMFAVKRGWASWLGRSMPQTPVKFMTLLIALSAIAYIPMAVMFSPTAWSSFGPFSFQTSRFFHYLVYFLIGTGVGSAGIDKRLLASGGKLARRWPLWVTAALLAFAAATTITIISLTTATSQLGWSIAADFGFVFSCAASCLAFMSLFIRFAQERSALCDSLAQNSYAIYLIHYALVSWLGYLLLPASLPAVVKGGIVFSGALGLSWCLGAVLRRIPADSGGSQSGLKVRGESLLYRLVALDKVQHVTVRIREEDEAVSLILIGLSKKGHALLFELLAGGVKVLHRNCDVAQAGSANLVLGTFALGRNNLD